jgi:hypothetical protein
MKVRKIAAKRPGREQAAPAAPESILARLAICEDPLVAQWADALLHGEVETGGSQPTERAVGGLDRRPRGED